MKSTTSQKNLERRDFITQACAAGTASVMGLAGVPTHVLAAKQSLTSVVNLRYENFEELVGQQFVIVRQDRHVGLELIQVRELEQDDLERPLHIRQKAFSLLLVGSSENKLKADTYRVRNYSLGAFDLFFHEVGPNDDTNTAWYEVVFN